MIDSIRIGVATRRVELKRCKHKAAERNEGHVQSPIAGTLDIIGDRWAILILQKHA
jgi:DNA-binding HxlR family transcriptional regulator